MFEIHDEQENLRNDLALSVFVLDLICGLRSYVVCTYSYTVTKGGGASSIIFACRPPAVRRTCTCLHVLYKLITDYQSSSVTTHTKSLSIRKSSIKAELDRNELSGQSLSYCTIYWILLYSCGTSIIEDVILLFERTGPSKHCIVPVDLFCSGAGISNVRG